VTPTLIQCDFCNELSGSSLNSFGQIYGAHPDTRILFRSNRFAVLPSIGQLVEGYLLVVPINHFKAVGDLPVSYLDEFIKICDWVGGILKDQYGPYILFEHGARSLGVGGCGIYHAHLHAMPLAKASDPIDLLKLRFPYTEFAGLNEISAHSACLSSYLFYQDSNARLYLFNTGPLPSQYMRKLLADSLGENDWNWRNSGREERLVATIERLSGLFDTERNLLQQP
jgi:diadenosine tetraphosphate (Ap4A) HIT family hydrolase